MSFKKNILEIDYNTKLYNSDYDSDYVLVSGGVNDLKPARHTFDEMPFQYNQNHVDTMSCSCFGTGACLSTNVGCQFSEGEFKKIWDLACSKGQASHKWGGYVLNMMCEWKDEHNKQCSDDKVYFLRTDIGSEEFFKILDKGYRIATGYNNHIGFNEDWINDGVVDRNYNDSIDNEDWGDSYGGGHCISIAKTNNYKVKGCEYVIIDNYYGEKNRLKNNIYGIKKELIKELSDRGILFKNGYYFVFEHDIPVDKIDKKFLENIKKKVFEEGYDYVMITATKDGSKPSGEMFYINNDLSLRSANSMSPELRQDINLAQKENKKRNRIIGIYKEDLKNFKIK